MSQHSHSVTRNTMEVGARGASAVRHAPARYLNEDQVAFFWDHGYLRMEQVFTPDEMDELDTEMDRLMVEWANYAAGWSGDWRKVYMDEETEKQSKLIAMHDLWYYSAAWTRAVLNPNLAAAMSDLLGPDVELHHATMHVKPPETGHPFPMHQDNAFYAHRTDRFIDTLVTWMTPTRRMERSASSTGRTSWDRWTTSGARRAARSAPPTCPPTSGTWRTPWRCRPGAVTWCASTCTRCTAHT